MAKPTPEMIEEASRQVVSAIAAYIGNLIHNQKDAFYLKDRFEDAVKATSQLVSIAAQCEREAERELCARLQRHGCIIEAPVKARRNENGQNGA